jgi:hypothetical protein
MAGTVVILGALGMLIMTCAALIYGAGWLIIASPFMRWCLIAVVAFLAFRVILLLFEYVEIWWSDEYPDVVLEDEIRAKTEIAFSTQIVPTRRSGKFTLLAQGSLTNNSDHVIESITIWCRVPKLGFGDSEMASNTLALAVRPGESKSFSGLIASDVTGVAKTGHLALQAPDQHFCRLDRVNRGT